MAFWLHWSSLTFFWSLWLELGECRISRWWSHLLELEFSRSRVRSPCPEHNWRTSLGAASLLAHSWTYDDKLDMFCHPWLAWGREVEAWNWIWSVFVEMELSVPWQDSWLCFYFSLPLEILLVWLGCLLWGRRSPLPWSGSSFSVFQCPSQLLPFSASQPPSLPSLGTDLRSPWILNWPQRCLGISWTRIITIIRSIIHLLSIYRQRCKTIDWLTCCKGPSHSL